MFQSMTPSYTVLSLISVSGTYVVQLAALVWMVVMGSGAVETGERAASEILTDLK